MEPQKLTIVICTHNRVDLLKNAIASLNASHRPSEVEIKLLIIANACSDETVNFLNSYSHSLDQQPLPLEFQEEPIAGKSHALNRAIALVNDGFLCFVDDDHRVDSNFFLAINQAINDSPEALMICGKIIPDWTGNEPGWIHEMGQYKIYPSPVPHFEMGDKKTSVTTKTKLPGGGNLIVHHSVFKKVGGFSVELGPSGHNLAGSEDSDFVLRALSSDISILYVPEIIQYHYVDEERLKLNYLIRKSYQRTRTLTLAKQGRSQLPPRYLWRKLAENFFKFIFSSSSQRRRYYSMRIAATLGEIKGFLDSKFND